MAATLRSVDDLINESTGIYKDQTAGAISAQDGRDAIFSMYQPQGICQGRLTLESGVPISTTDQTAKMNVFFTPHNGNRLGLFDGTSWKQFTFSELTLALGTLTADKPYDVFVFDNSGTLTLEFSAAWTNDTTRADAITLQDGVWVKSGATTRLLLGSIYTTTTTQTEDSASKRYVGNVYNRTWRQLILSDATSHNYTTAAYQEWNAGTNSPRTYFICPVEALTFVAPAITLEGVGGVRGAISLDTVGSIVVSGGSNLNAAVVESAIWVSARPSLGRHILIPTEFGSAGATQTQFKNYGSVFS